MTINANTMNTAQIRFFKVYAVGFLIAFSGALAFANDSALAPAGTCQKIHGMPGPEDITLNRTRNLLYVSSHNRRNADEEGKLFAIDLSQSDAELKPIPLNVQYPPHFKPHGMSWLEVGGKERLYVISHPLLDGDDQMHTVEVFEGSGLNFTHLKTLRSPLLVSPNDLHAMPDGRIFVSNDNASATGWQRSWDTVFRRKTSRISYFDGKDWSYIGRPVAAGNGVLVKQESGKAYLYRSAFFENAVIKYEIVTSAQGSTDLQEVARMDVTHGPDNLELDEQGNMLVAVHPSVFRFLMHLASPKQYSPSQIVHINLANQQVSTLYHNDGSEISAASTAVVQGQRMIISQVFEDFLLVCPRP
jgi:arylesterase / paraoxonase